MSSSTTKRQQSSGWKPSQRLQAGTSQPPADEEWAVWELAVSPTEERAASLMRRGAVELYSLMEQGLVFERGLAGEETTLCMPAGVHFTSPTACIAAEQDRVYCWDARTQQQTPRITLRALSKGNAQLHSCSSSGDLVAAGGTGVVHFFDMRKPESELQRFEDAHDTDVTIAAFHPERAKVLVTADEEGNVAAWQLTSINEEADYQAGLSLAGQTPVQAGFYGAGLERMYFCTATNTFHLWDWSAACQEDAPGGAGTLADIADAPAQLAAFSPLGESLSVQSITGCCYDEAAGQLWLGASNPQGVAGMWPVAEPKESGSAASFGAGQLFLEGHTKEVRAVQWLPRSRRAISAGEDGYVALWEGGSVGGRKKKNKKAAS